MAVMWMVVHGRVLAIIVIPLQPVREWVLTSSGDHPIVTSTTPATQVHPLMVIVFM